MKTIIRALLFTILFNTVLSAQNNIDKILFELEKNNTTLSSLRKNADAEKIGNKTGIYLQNPAFEFNYLWVNPASINNRMDISIKQSFDFPTSYRYRNQISSIKNEQIDLEYQKQRKELLLESRLICYDLIYTNALKSELSKWINGAQSIAGSYKAKFDIGETNILEYNKAQLNLLNLTKEMESLEIERNSLLGELTRLNGGNFIDFVDSVFQTTSILVDFDQWYSQAEQNNPRLNWLKKEIDIRQKQISLDKALSLPKLYAGYISERTIGQDFQGVTIGLSIPFWEHKNSVKYSKAKVIAFEEIAIDNKMQLFGHLKVLHTKTIGLQNNYIDFRLKLQSFDNSELLKKALDKGEISLINYIVELSIFYESAKKLLELERDLNKTMAELNHYL